MMKKLDPKEFSLPPRTVLEEHDPNTIAVTIKRKSRIIMADGRAIVEKAAKIKQIRPGVNVALKTSAPVCGKTAAFLEGKGIRLIPEDR